MYIFLILLVYYFYYLGVIEKFTHNPTIKIDWVIGWISPTQLSNCNNSNNLQRVRDNQELKYCLKSIYKYASWINKIYIILGNKSQPPSWLQQTDRIVLIPETSLYSSIQPNSETKKLYYANIPNLSEYFIAGDDDYFLGNYLYPSDFFTNDNIPIINSVHLGWDGKAHIPIAWKKSSYQQALLNIDNIDFYQNMGCLRKNPWKEIKKYLINNKLAIKGRIRKPDIWINDTNNHNITVLLKQIINTKPKFICINDDWDTTNHSNYIKQMKELHLFFTLFYPDKYHFE